MAGKGRFDVGTHFPFWLFGIQRGCALPMQREGEQKQEQRSSIDSTRLVGAVASGRLAWPSGRVSTVDSGLRVAPRLDSARVTPPAAAPGAGPGAPGASCSSPCIA
ncbi:predicted protein [Histoplasma capsulatum G186AR]|uniref:Uncharacterized protein n=1 Tax=Ajellomyces capsulatus (strain G186AR / H82 / ATCC MYA-2454 / RMSCC 2432) TaxID=447093 RepID=C0NG40_AJECG|nr:uncharacterized protein HCBG_01856 [Histoplasma capsulatum G186AR]EEH10211.1 predicted protein [Histoplasma capsulatum G186AR]